MDRGLELFIPILEILEIEVCNISYKPRDIGNLSFSTSSYPGNIGKRICLFSHILEILESGFLYFLISWKYWKMDFHYFLISWKNMDMGFFMFSHNIENLL